MRLQIQMCVYEHIKVIKLYNKNNDKHMRNNN